MAPVKRKPKVGSGTMTVKVYPLLEETIENGIKWGINRVFKHRESDSITHEQLLDETIIDTILHYVMIEVCERFEFPELGEY